MKLEESKISLSKMKFYAFHGVLDEEQKIGGNYEVSIELYTNLKPALKSDNISDTIDYAIVYALVKKEMTKPSKLIEHLAGRIGKTLLKKFEQLNAVGVTVEKIAPPVNGDLPCASVTLKLCRDGR